MVYLLFVLGFILLIRGAEWLIDGASTLARRLGISELIVGLTVVAFGTSLPELVVNLFASAESAQLAIGNVLGSNISNTLLILGVASLIYPLSVKRHTVFREIVFNVGAALMLGVLVSERFLKEGGFGGLDHIDGIILMSYFLLFLHYVFGRTGIYERKQKLLKTPAKKLNLGNVMVKILLGSVGLYLGGLWIVDGAVAIATVLNVSDALIGLTIVALGTSLPELAATVIAVRKKNVDIAVGNVVGSNLFNIFWVLGFTAFIRPIPFDQSLIVDVAVNLAIAVVLLIALVSGKNKMRISAAEGYTFLTLYAIYLGFVIYRG